MPRDYESRIAWYISGILKCQMKKQMSSWDPRQNAYIENSILKCASAKADTEAPQSGSVVVLQLAYADALQLRPLGLNTGLC